jgi:hypothetical protein
VPDDYLSEADLAGLGIDPDRVRHACPWAVTLVALDGSRCWAAADLINLIGWGGGR